MGCLGRIPISHSPTHSLRRARMSLRNADPRRDAPLLFALGMLYNQFDQLAAESRSAIRIQSASLSSKTTKTTARLSVANWSGVALPFAPSPTATRCSGRSMLLRRRCHRPGLEAADHFGHRPATPIARTWRELAGGIPDEPSPAGERATRLRTRCARLR